LGKALEYLAKMVENYTSDYTGLGLAEMVGIQ